MDPRPLLDTALADIANLLPEFGDRVRPILRQVGSDEPGLAPLLDARDDYEIEAFRRLLRARAILEADPRWEDGADLGPGHAVALDSVTPEPVVLLRHLCEGTITADLRHAEGSLAQASGPQPWNADPDYGNTFAEWMAVVRSTLELEPPPERDYPETLAADAVREFLNRFEKSPAYIGPRLVLPGVSVALSREPAAGVHLPGWLAARNAAGDAWDERFDAIDLRLDLCVKYHDGTIGIVSACIGVPAPSDVDAEGALRAAQQFAVRHQLPLDLAAAPVEVRPHGEGDYAAARQARIAGHPHLSAPSLFGRTSCRHPHGITLPSGDALMLGCRACSRIVQMIPVHRVAKEEWNPLWARPEMGPYLVRERARRALRGESDLIIERDLEREPPLSITFADYAVEPPQREPLRRPRSVADALWGTPQ